MWAGTNELRVNDCVRSPRSLIVTLERLMAKEPESNLNFDWLSGEKTDDGPVFSASDDGPDEKAEPQFPGPPDEPSNAVTEKPEPEQAVTEEPELEKSETASVFDDIQMPDPEKNVSDGTTLVMKDGPALDGFSPEAEEFAPPEESSPAGDESSESTGENDVEAEAAAPTETSEEPEPPPDELVGDASVPETSSQEAPAEETPTEENPEAETLAEDEVESNIDDDDTVQMSVGDLKSPSETASEESDDDDTVVLTPPVTPPPSAQTDQAKPADKKPAPASVEKAGKSNLILILLISYASAITLALIFLLTRDNTKPHHLESLPDVAPEKENALSYVPVNATLAPGHTLRIGDKQRFGNLEVEILRVTREPIEFVHYTGNTGRTRAPSEPVFKLWLKFTNVSNDQTFQPLGRQLVLRWVTNSKGQERSNFYIAPRNASAGDEPQAQLYHLSSASDWDLKDQNLDAEIGPGESMECYLATEEGVNVEGDLAWRVQFRKGLSPSGNGVTTMIEVAFDPNQLAT